MIPKVSVCMITYNQEKYIAEAIESVLVQQVNFDYEIVIGEDCSTDRTREIVKEYAEKYPDKIRLLLHPHNLGGLLGKNNFVATFKACQGQYIAMLEGDDYWTDPYKLQKQADFLDNHFFYLIYFNTTKAIFKEDKDRFYIIPPPQYQRKFLTLEDLLRLNFVATPLVIFRNGLLKEFPEWLYKLAMGDYPLSILTAQHGKIGYIPELISIYRIYSGSTFSSRKTADNIRSLIKFDEVINKHHYYSFRLKIIVIKCKARQRLIESFLILDIMKGTTF